jgi:3-oxoacyl-(acyl-carrier-protein) synthase
LKSVFGARTASLPVTSIKGSLGHAMGAASSLESIACVRTMQEGLIPPTSNYEVPDPECDLDVVASGPRECDVRVVVNNSAGIGGANAAVTFRRVD